MTNTPRILPAGDGLRRRRRRADAEGVRRLPTLALLLAASLWLGGCLMPNRGTPVFVDSRAGDYWSGKGWLLEVSPDRTRCRVAVRDDALFVRKPWVPCSSVHERRMRG